MKNLKKIDKKTFKENPKFFKYRKFLKIASIPFVIVGTGLGFYLQENNINEANAPLWFWIVLYVLLGIGIYIFGFAIYIVFKDPKIIANKIYAFMDAFKIFILSISDSKMCWIPKEILSFSIIGFKIFLFFSESCLESFNISFLKV